MKKSRRRRGRRK